MQAVQQWPLMASEPLWRRVAAHPDTLTVLWGLALGVGVCWPLLGDRSLFLLDWVSGPHPPLPPDVLYGLNGGLTTGLLPALVLTVLVRVVGPPATWVPLLVVFPVAAAGAGRLAAGRRPARLAAATLYCANPWVFNRIYAGHLTLLLGYALLPFAVRSALGAAERGPAGVLGPVLWWAVLTALSPHYAWIFGLVLVAAAGVSVVAGGTGAWRALARAAGWLAASIGAFVLTSAYVLLPHRATELPTTVGSTSLALYRTTGDPHLGLFPNVLGLYGFWRLGPGPRLPKQVVTGWPLVLAALLVVVVVGFATELRRRGDPARRRLAWLLVVVGVAGYLLALGDQGPTGPAFRWAYDHVPFFALMREPQKFLALLALADAVGFAWGVERLFAQDAATAPAAATTTGVADRGATGGAPGGAGSRRMALAATAVGIALPLAYTPTLFDGLAGQIGPSTLPPAYQQADRLMGDGPGRVLFVPWHLYESQPFTGGRVIATIGPSAFRRPVIAGDNVEAGTVETQSTSLRSAYLQRLFAHPGTQPFGAAIAPLGVKYVVLAKTVDWRSYRWLSYQPDLHLVLDDATLEVWRNDAYAGAGTRVGARAPVRRLSPVAYAVPPGRPGTATIDAPYQRGWRLDGRPGQPTAVGTVRFELTGTAGGLARFTPWGLVQVGDAVSGAAVLAVIVGAVVDARRRRAGCVRARGHRR